MTAFGSDAASVRHVMASLRYLAEAIDAKDPYTRGHVDRVARYSMKTLDWMDERKDPDLREQLLAAALLHDIGKLRVPDSVLKKPGRLDPLERLEIELHPVHACTILGSDELHEWIGPAIRAHHEKLDGTGYPDGIGGDEIPLAARIIAVADVFDACTSKRIYRREERAFSDAAAIGILKDEVAKSHLDARVVGAFEAAHEAAHVSLARAASYAYSANPLATSGGGEERPPLAVAREILQDALESQRQKARPDRHTLYRIAARLATVANLQGDPVAALRFAGEAASLADHQRGHDRATMQRGLALREQGKLDEARAAMLSIADREDDDWLRGSAHTMLAKVALAQGDLAGAQSSIERAAEACERMRRSLGAESAERTLAIAIRWWSPDRLAKLEGTLELLETRRARRLGLGSAVRSGRAATERFEAIGSRGDAGKARAELAHHLSDRGEIDRAVFMLERERAFARDVGDRSSFLHRSVWLAEAYARRAACQRRSAGTADMEARALRLLEEARATAGRDPTLVQLVDMGLGIAHWCGGRLVDARTVALEMLKAGFEGHGPATIEPWLVARFLVRSAEGDGQGLVQIGLEADRVHHAIRAVECLAEASRCSPDCAAVAAGPLRALFERMDRRCWLAAHPSHSATFAAVVRRSSEVPRG